MPPTPNERQLRNVSDTALWVATYRALESERPDAHFRDPWARRLAGERGFKVLEQMPKGRALSWPMVARTVLFDRVIRECVDDGVDLVLDLAAGLDTRPYRMDLPPNLLWVEVDLPDMILYKGSILDAEAPTCRVERFALDLADREARRDLFRRLAGRGERALVLTEGLLIYLPQEEVAALATDLEAMPSLHYWATDLASPGLLRWMSSTWGKEVEDAGAPFRFGPEEGPEFFARYGWRTTATHSTFHAAAKLRRLPLWMRPFAWLPQPRSWKPQRVWSATCLFERTAKAPGRDPV